MSARELVVDLAVHYEELQRQPDPSWPPGLPIQQRLRLRGTTRERWSRWYTHCERLFRLTVDAGCAIELAPERPTDAIAVLAEAVRESSFLGRLNGALYDGLSYIGHEVGYFYGGQPWDELCLFRSAVEFLHALSGEPTDHDDVEQIMAQYGIEMFEALEIPKGMPQRHWWWFRASP